MSGAFEARVLAANGGSYVRLYETELDEHQNGLEVMADQGDQEATVVLDIEGVKRLRLALQRYERQYKRQPS